MSIGYPRIMVAPNGGRKTKEDHPAIPLTIEELLICATDCHAAGADAIHAHMRDENGEHVLDVGMYREFTSELSIRAPQMAIQATTEAIGRYTAEQQRAFVKELQPTMVSASIKEICSQGEESQIKEFYHWAKDSNVNIQHILYSPAEVSFLETLQNRTIIPKGKLNMLFVLGRYSDGVPSDPDAINLFLEAAARNAHWMICAFGKSETDCLATAYQMGGTIRVGFENNVLNSDGSVAKDNCERVRNIMSAISA